MLDNDYLFVPKQKELSKGKTSTSLKNSQSDYNHLIALYGGKENLPLAQLIFNYFSKGAVNHEIKFSEFIYFIRNL